MKTKSVHQILVMLKAVIFATQNLAFSSTKTKPANFVTLDHSLENLEVGAQKDFNEKLFYMKKMTKFKNLIFLLPTQRWRISRGKLMKMLKILTHLKKNHFFRKKSLFSVITVITKKDKGLKVLLVGYTA